MCVKGRQTWVVLTLALILSFLAGLSSCDDCRPWIPPGPDDLSFIYSEPPQDSLADHITTYAVLRQLRQDTDVNAVMGRRTWEILSRVFMEDSLRDVPVFQDVYCGVDKDPSVKGFQRVSLPFHTYLTDDRVKRGQTIFLDLSQILEGIRNPLNPETHKFIERFRDDMRRILKFKWEAQTQEIKEDIANQMDLELSEVTFVGIVDQRKSPPLPGDEGVKIKSFKKSYFQDAIADMRDSYDNVAFLYVGNNMTWARKNLRNEDDLYFVGGGGEESGLSDWTEVEALGRDLALASRCDHTIVSRGDTAMWAANLAGGEYYTEYGSYVPNRVIDKQADEARKEQLDEGPLVDKEGLLTLHFPKAENKDSFNLDYQHDNDGWLSWLFNFFF